MNNKSMLGIFWFVVVVLLIGFSIRDTFKDKIIKPKLLVSSSVWPFEEKALKIWKLEKYKWPRDIFKPVVFFGMYHIGDFYHCLRHLGPKTIFWAGSDIVNLQKGKTFGRYLKPNKLIPWHKMLGRKTQHFVENELERRELAEMGIKALVRPSFLEDVDDFPIRFEQSDNPQVYISGRPDREEEYGFGLVGRLAEKCPDVFFHVYGAESPYGVKLNNIIYHGNVPPCQFNIEIRRYHCGLRTNDHDGFSEITAKSVLMGQYPITKIKYDNIDSYDSELELIKKLNDLKNKKLPNSRARNYWRWNVNRYPWMEK